MRSMLVIASAAALISPAHGQHIKTLEKAWRSCEGGYYTGPREGRRGHTMDKFLWVVTPAFAKQFCMPDSMVSHELKGAEAIAFRMVDGADADRCTTDDKGGVHCIENSTARFEIYLSQSLQLPAANPQVNFYEGSKTTSDWMLANVTERDTRPQRYAKGEYKLAPGEVPRYRNPYSYPGPGHHFGLLYAHDGRKPWSVAPIWERGFRGNWVDGMDLLILEQNLALYLNSEMRHYEAAKLKPGTEQGQYLIVMDKPDDDRNNNVKDPARDYAHVIHLPRHFSRKVREAAISARVGK